MALGVCRGTGRWWAGEGTAGQILTDMSNRIPTFLSVSHPLVRGPDIVSARCAPAVPRNMTTGVTGTGYVVGVFWFASDGEGVLLRINCWEVIRFWRNGRCHWCWST